MARPHKITPINAPFHWLLAIDPPDYQYRVPAWWELGSSDRHGTQVAFEGFQEEAGQLKRVGKTEGISRQRISVHRRKKKYSIRHNQ